MQAHFGKAMGRGKGNKGEMSLVGLAEFVGEVVVENKGGVWSEKSDKGTQTVSSDSDGGERLEKGSAKGKALYSLETIGTKGTGKAFVRIRMQYESRWLHLRGVLGDVDF